MHILSSFWIISAETRHVAMVRQAPIRTVHIFLDGRTTPSQNEESTQLPLVSDKETMAKKTRRIKFKRAPGAPRRFQSAYMFFAASQHRVIRQNSCDKKVSKVPFPVMPHHVYVMNMPSKDNSSHDPF